MIIFLITALISAGFVVFAVQNNYTIDLALGSYQLFQIPIFILAIVFFFLGIIFAWVLNFIGSLNSFFLLQSKIQEGNELKTTLNLLIRRLHLLEIELDKIKKSLGKKISSDERAL